MMLPRRARPRPPPIACATRNMPSRLTAITSRHVASSKLSTGAKNASMSSPLVAALFNRIEQPPKASTRSAMRRTAIGSATSQAMPSARVLWRSAISAASASVAPASRSTSTTAAPNSARPAAKQRPRMPQAPVITAVLPARSNRARYEVCVIVCSLCCHGGDGAALHQELDDAEVKLGIDVERALLRHHIEPRARAEDGRRGAELVRPPGIDRGVHVVAGWRVLTADDGAGRRLAEADGAVGTLLDQVEIGRAARRGGGDDVAPGL